MDRLEDILVNLAYQESESPCWLIPLCKTAKFILDATNYVDMGLRRLGCWFVGHQEKMGDWRMYEPDWCARCYCNYPSEKTTLPLLLNHGYCWMAERDWRWFNCLDEWLCCHISSNRGPSWWEY